MQTSLDETDGTWVRIGTTEAAQLLGVTRQRVCQLKGLLRPAKVWRAGKSFLRWDRDRVEELIAQRARARAAIVNSKVVAP